MSDRRRYLSQIRSLAYDAALFERCITLILRIIESGNVDDDREEGRRILVSLFPIYFSGTHATIEQRLAITRSLTLSEDLKKSALGLATLKAVLEAAHFGPGWDFEFGAHSRDYGWQPRTVSEAKQWFRQGLNLVEELACSDNPLAQNVRAILAEQFRGLWSGAGMYDELERVCRRISEREFWADGWIAVRQTIRYDSNGLPPGISARLAALERLLQPEKLSDKVRAIVLSDAVIYVGTESPDDDGEDFAISSARAGEIARSLGKEVGGNKDVCGELLPELVKGGGQQLWAFGLGLAEGSKNPEQMWGQLTSQLAVAAAGKRSPQILGAFLSGLQAINSQMSNTLLDRAVVDAALAEWYPLLQAAAGIDDPGTKRLILSLKLGKAPIHLYRGLGGGGVTHRIPGPEFNELLLLIASSQDGVNIAIEILCMRISFARDQSSTSELIDVGCELMRRLTFTRSKAADNYRLRMLAKNSLIGEKGAAAVREICRNLKDAISKSETYAFYHVDLLQILFAVQPLAALESICAGDEKQIRLGVSILEGAAQLQRYPFDAIPEADLLQWCDEKSDIRYPVVAAGIAAVQSSGEAGGQRWTDIALKFLDKAPNRVEVLKKFITQFSPTGWVGSHATIVESNVKLLDELKRYPDPELQEFIASQKLRFHEVVKAEHEMERLLYQDRDERFEW